MTAALLMLAYWAAVVCVFCALAARFAGEDDDDQDGGR